MQLYTEIKGQGTPILCLHGHPGSGRSMGVFTEVLAENFCAIAPDLRGYGRSPTRAPFTMQEHLQDLDQLMQDQSKFWILGWSLGGILAIEMALRHPNRVQGLILVATAARPRGNHPPIIWQDNLLTGIAGLINCLSPAWPWNIEQLGKRSLFRYLIRQHTSYAYQKLAREGAAAYLQTSRFATQALTQAIRQGYNQLPALSTIQAPCLMLSGEQDRHITATASRETANALLHCDLQQYADVAHLFPWEIPDQVQKDLRRWLAKHEPTAQLTP
ncbi:MAG: alpha/beta hydrolase [Cyanobacteria bacterium P01_A01_bin.105]